MGRTPKVGGVRTTRIGGESQGEAPVLPNKKSGLFQFRSRDAACWYSIRRRIVEKDADGMRFEVPPRTTDTDEPMDVAKFEDHYFETASREFAEALIAKAKSMRQYGVGNIIWSLDDETAAQDQAKERELRAMLAANPEIADRVLRPSESEDFKLPPPTA